jgi:hypothetical protein
MLRPSCDFSPEVHLQLVGILRCSGGFRDVGIGFLDFIWKSLVQEVTDRDETKLSFRITKLRCTPCADGNGVSFVPVLFIHRD